MTTSPNQPSRAPFDVVRLSTLGELQPWRMQWNALSQDIPFRRWEWMEGWWRHYGQTSGHPYRG
ncbi:MAG TPA: hypothetical protein VGY55_23270, partial [Pirellulales bacterium]|nr:hypothetical protein [Pirellulales bacterium]